VEIVLPAQGSGVGYCEGHRAIGPDQASWGRKIVYVLLIDRIGWTNVYYLDLASSQRILQTFLHQFVDRTLPGSLPCVGHPRAERGAHDAVRLRSPSYRSPRDAQETRSKSCQARRDCIRRKSPAI
jgi:hypothetical protein